MSINSVTFLSITVGLGAFIYHKRYANKPHMLDDGFSDSGGCSTSVDDSIGRVKNLACMFNYSASHSFKNNCFSGDKINTLKELLASGKKFFRTTNFDLWQLCSPLSRKVCISFEGPDNGAIRFSIKNSLTAFLRYFISTQTTNTPFYSVHKRAFVSEWGWHTTYII